MRAATAAAGLLAIGVWAPPIIAQAQDAAGQGYFSRSRSVSVRERPRPDYEAIGIRASAFTAFPKVGVDFIYSDNIYASETNEVSDVIVRIRPEISAVSNWSRHRLGGFARASINRFLDNSSENTNEYGIGASGRFDIYRSSSLTGSTSYEYLAEPRSAATSPGNAEEPTEYSLFQNQIGWLGEFTRTRLSARLEHRGYDFQDVDRSGGGVLSQDDRDRTELSQVLRAEYAASPAWSVFSQVAANQRRYRLEPPQAQFDRDSSGYDVAIGSSLDLSAFIRGEIQAGYLSQSYEDPRFSELQGFSTRALLDWFPTQLTTVNLSLSRTVEEAVSVASPGGIGTTAGVRVDHELRRNVILTGQLGYLGVDYERIDRQDRTLSMGLSAAYLLNRRAGVTAGYNYLDRDSTGLERYPDFTENRLYTTLTFQY